MALINCPECNREISDKATSCPHCGYPITNQPPKPEPVENVVEQETAPQNSKKKSIAILSAIAVVIIAIIIVIISAVDTTSTKPDDMNDEHYQYGKSILGAVDQYLDQKSTVEESMDRIDVLRKSEGNLPETEFGEKNHSMNFIVEMQVSHLDYVLMNHRFGQATLSELIEARNELAKTLNEKTR